VALFVAAVVVLGVAVIIAKKKKMNNKKQAGEEDSTVCFSIQPFLWQNCYRFNGQWRKMGILWMGK